MDCLRALRRARSVCDNMVLCEYGGNFIRRVKGMDSQELQVKAYMEQHGSITNWDAFKDLGITRLSGRIFNLRKAGVQIETIYERNEKTGTRFGRYVIKKEQSDKPTAL